MKKFGVLLLVAAMLLSLVGCSLPSMSKQDRVERIFESEIKAYNEKHGESTAVYLEIGEQVQHDTFYATAINAVNEEGYALSSDESVVTVSHDGVVTAVGKGSAYVMTYWGNDKRSIRLYIVTNPAPTTTTTTTATTTMATTTTTSVKDDTDRIQQAIDNCDANNTLEMYVGEEYRRFKENKNTVVGISDTVAVVHEDGVVEALSPGMTYVVSLSYDREYDTAYQVVVKNWDKAHEALQERIKDYEGYTFDPPMRELYIGQKEEFSQMHVVIENENVVKRDGMSGIVAVGEGRTYVLAFGSDFSWADLYEVVVLPNP